MKELEEIFDGIFVQYDSFKVTIDRGQEEEGYVYYIVDIEDLMSNKISFECRHRDCWELDISDDSCWDTLCAESVWSYIYFELMLRLERTK